MKWNAIEFTGIVLFIIGFYGLISRRKVVKSILSLGVMDVGVVLFFLGINYRPGMSPPVGNTAAPADPLPQALMITAIIIGTAVTAVALKMFTVLYHRYGTMDWNDAHLVRREEDK